MLNEGLLMSNIDMGSVGKNVRPDYDLKLVTVCPSA